MKKLVVVSVVVFSLIVSPCFAIEYCKDFLESGNPGGWGGSSLKTFEDEWTLTVGEEVELDIWINDVPLPLLSGGFWIEYDPSKVSIVSVAAYDGNDIPGPGPWEVAFTVKFPDAGGPGTYLLQVGPPLMPATPDGDGDIIIAKVRFRCESVGNATITISTIPGLDTFVGDTTVFDPEIIDNNVVIHQEIDYCEGDFDYDGDCDGTDAARFKLDFGRSIFENPCPPDGPSPVPKTGQTTSSATGDDGDLERGVALVTPRFTDNGDGTVTDNQTGLIWLKHANCFGNTTWYNALSACNGLADGDNVCLGGSFSLSDGSQAGDWRLPHYKELFSIVDAENIDPPLPSGHPFSNVQPWTYWSSTIYSGPTLDAWAISMVYGYVNFRDMGTSHHFWCVRGGH